MFHIALHFLVPGILVLLFFRRDWKLAYLLMASTILVDLDHLLADPIYDPQRCSIGFHPLHTFFPIALYAGMTLIQPLRYLGLGLVIHMALDSIDCRYTNGIWYV